MCTEQERSPCKDSLGPGAREDRRRDAHTESAARRECGIARRDERRHAKRVHRSLRMNPGYDERESEYN